MIKLIVSDIDGTLLEDGTNVVNPELFEVILKLREKGIQFAAASGRQWASIERVFSPIKEKIFYLSDNGAYVGCHGRSLFVNGMERSLVMELIEDIRSEGLEAMLCAPDYVYLDSRDEELYNWMKNGYQYKIKQIDDLRNAEGVFTKVSAYREKNIEAFSGRLWEKYHKRTKMACAGDMWLDFMAPEVNKGQAVKLLQESLQITPEETMAFGDQMNDVEMLEQVYYSFAIGNARPEVKETARFQADTNTRDGVLKILKLLL
ncbi:MAG: HAD family hydrolase [Lachnospiraceae bacterium]